MNAKRSTERRQVVFCLLAALAVLEPRPLAPATIIVEGPCNLNGAIAAANTDTAQGSCPAGAGPDVIRLTGNVLLEVVDNDQDDGPNGLPSVTSKITIDGQGYSVFREFVSAPPFRIFHVGGSGELELRDVTVSFGLTGLGGGVFSRGSLTLTHTTVGFNHASQRGGGLYAAGGSSSLIFDSTIEFNSVGVASSDDGGGGVWAGPEALIAVSYSTIASNSIDSDDRAYGGGIAGPAATITIDNSTIADNTAEAAFYSYGGGVAGGDLTIVNSTISGNSVTRSFGAGFVRGGGVWGAGSVRQTTLHGNTALRGASAYGDLGTLSLSSSLFAANIDGDHCEGALLDAGGGNLADDTTCLPTIAATLSGLDSSLANNGGATETHRLLDGSTAIDAAESCGLSVDQRGVERETSCDSGAFEWFDCPLFILSETTINFPFSHSACHTTFLGPNLEVTATGTLDLFTGRRFTIMDGVSIEDGAIVRLTTP